MGAVLCAFWVLPKRLRHPHHFCRRLICAHIDPTNLHPQSKLCRTHYIGHEHQNKSDSDTINSTTKPRLQITKDRRNQNAEFINAICGFTINYPNMLIKLYQFSQISLNHSTLSKELNVIRLMQAPE
jgi:hypothetical protein